jgi:hypothetical protein
MQIISLENLPNCQPYITGCFEMHGLDNSIKEGDFIQIFASKMRFHKYIGQVVKIYSSNFMLKVNENNILCDILIDPIIEGWYWDQIKIKKISCIEDIA